MPDYKEMYLKMARAMEKAIDELIAAQRECEEMYIESSELNSISISTPDEQRE